MDTRHISIEADSGAILVDGIEFTSRRDWQRALKRAQRLADERSETVLLCSYLPGADEPHNVRRVNAR